MKRSLMLLTAMMFCVSWVVSEKVLGSESNEVVKRPLDLPAKGSGLAEEEEELSETINFYGGEYEGDGFFWCLDKSCSMMGSKLQTMKAEVSSAINSLSPRADIGLVSFSSNTMAWRLFPVKATPGNKSAAQAWLDTLSAGGGTILAPAGVQTLQICNISKKRKKAVIVLGDGMPGDQDAALTNITASNYKQTPVNTILVSSVPGQAFMQALASLNNGSFRFIP